MWMHNIQYLFIFLLFFVCLLNIKKVVFVIKEFLNSNHVCTFYMCKGALFLFFLFFYCLVFIFFTFKLNYLFLLVNIPVNNSYLP